MTIATKADFLGMWRIDRRIVDARGPDAHFAGTMTVREMTDAPDTLFVSEGGYLTVGDQAAVSANRTYRWSFSAPTFIDVLFEDGRPFHTIELATPTPKAHHDCPPDRYDVAYEFLMPNEWRSTWTVTGPRKDYVMTSIMTRQTKHSFTKASSVEPMAQFEAIKTK